mgnify:CR=1 FL=1
MWLRVLQRPRAALAQKSSQVTFRSAGRAFKVFSVGDPQAVTKTSRRAQSVRESASRCSRMDAASTPCRGFEVGKRLGCTLTALVARKAWIRDCSHRALDLESCRTVQIARNCESARRAARLVERDDHGRGFRAAAGEGARVGEDDDADRALRAFALTLL